MQNGLAERTAYFIAHHRRWVLAAAFALVAISAAIIFFRVRLASDVLDLLPRRFASVQAFKTFDREFSQARELTFAVSDESGEVDLEGFCEYFSEAMRKEPWIVRVMDRSPLETTTGVQDVQIVAAPLLLNLEPEEFTRVMSALEPAAIEARLAKLRQQLESGSPKAEFDLDFDPLGVVGPALKPLAGSFATEQSRPLASPDGKMRLIIAETNQPGLDAHSCQDVMRKVDDFKQRALTGWTEGKAPEILVTGRTAYVGELSQKMRSDVTSTFGGSFLTVAFIFFIGFGRLRPLFSILHVLLLCCVVAMAAGVLIFGELNMITIGLCAIIVGLGEDFGMMLYAFYQEERAKGESHQAAIAAALRHHGSGVIYGSLTTAAAFVSLLLTECIGFQQLGMLIAIGILFSGLMMMTVFFVFLSKEHRPPRMDLVTSWGSWFVDKVVSAPRTAFFATTALLVGLGIYVISPANRLHFDANPRSLEPRNSQAGHALRAIQAKMPMIGETVFVMIEAPNMQEFHSRWKRAQTSWDALVEKGELKSAITPTGLVVSPERARSNASKLNETQLTAAREALTSAIAKEGLTAETFQSTFGLLDSLGAASKGDFALLDWHKSLPTESPWWFMIDHFFGNNPLIGIAYVSTPKKIESFDEKEKLRTALELPGIELKISGWSYLLADLIPWAKSRMFLLTGAMVGMNIVLLIFLYRRFFPLFILMTSLALSMVAMLATLKLCNVPLNLFNVLAFPLVLGVGVDYGIYIALALREKDVKKELKIIFKPVLLSGLTTVAGFGSLITAQNPALWSLGVVCAVGVGWCLFSTFCFILPACVWRDASK